MSVTALTSMAEYLDTDYSPDREYVDGVVMERNVGTRPHSRVLGQFVIAFHTRYPDPRRKKAYTFFASTLEEVQGDALVTAEPEIRLPLEEIFRGL